MPDMNISRKSSVNSTLPNTESAGNNRSSGQLSSASVVENIGGGERTRLNTAQQTDKSTGTNSLEKSVNVAREKSAISFVKSMFTQTLNDTKYLNAANKNLQLENKIGSALIADNEITNIARSIREYSGAPMSKEHMPPEDLEELVHVLGPIGGARDLDEGLATLDAHVLATHIKLDREEFNEPYAPNPSRRQNMFNVVTSPDNPIFPWNVHDFDMGIHEVSNWEEYPNNMQDMISNRWESYRANTETYEKVKILKGMENEKIGISGRSAEYILDKLDTKERKVFLSDILHIKWSTSQQIDDEQQSQRTDNPLGSAVRQHNVGDFANVVREKDPDDKNVARWVQGAITNGKPVISGPSGHSLRYLNHWAMTREIMRLSNDTRLESAPTLAQARLVMLANLMPPKSHHSYHEIMSASIGITDGDETLEYLHPESYEDLKGTDIGAATLMHAEKALNSPMSDPMPNPWAIDNRQTQMLHPTTVEQLESQLTQFGSNRDNVEMILRSVSSDLRIQLISRLKTAESEGVITKTQANIVKKIITELNNAFSHLPKVETTNRPYQ